MRHSILLLSLLLTAGSLFAQAPAGFSFQAVVRDTNDELLSDTPVGLRISILQGSINGAAVYVETHSTSTNANGLVSLQVGAGTVQSGSLATIDWGSGPYFIKSETDPNGGTNYTIAGTQQMMSVPYALFAANAGSGVFTSTAGVVHNTGTATQDFVVGSITLNNGPGIEDDGRLFFDKSKAAFRAGTTNSTQWDLAQVGSHSFASGQNTQATAGASTAMGEYTVASGTASTAIGAGNTASGDNSTALGNGTTAPSKNETVLGSHNNTDGYTGDATSWVPTDRLLTVGNGPNESQTSNALVLLKNGNTGIGVADPDAKLEVAGQVKITGGSPGADKVLTSDANGLASWVSPPVYTWVSQSEYISCPSPPCAIDHTIMATCPAGTTRVQIIDLEVTAQGWDPDINEMKVILPPDDRQSIGANVEFTITQVNLNKLIRVRALCVGGIPLPPY